MNKHPLADCANCSLKSAPYVPSKIPQGPVSYAIVAESPGFTETIAKEPLIGPSGKLIKEVLRRYDIDPNSCFLTNVVACAPGKDEKPPTDAIAACRPRLIDELANCGADRILAAGAFSARALLSLGPKAGILNTRKGPPRVVELNGVKKEVVPTVHPAAVLREGNFFKYLVTDVGKLKEKRVEWQPPRFKVADTERRALAYIKFLEQFDKLAVDIETGTEKDVAFEHPEDTEILCVGVAYDARHAVVFPGEVLQIPIIGKTFGLLLYRVQLCAQYGQFDVPVLGQYHPGITLSRDTLLEHYVLDERKKTHDLEQMSMEFLGSPPWKWMTKQYTKDGRTFAAVPRDTLYYYNAIDNINTYGLDEFFWPQLEAQGRTSLHDFLVRASTALMGVEREGVNIDLDYLEELDESLQAQLATLEQQLLKWIENPRSYLQVKSALARLGVNVASTALSVLQDVQDWVADESAYPKAVEILDFIDKLLEHRSIAILYGTYVKGLRKFVQKGRVHTSYLLHGTTTGRLSSSHPNLQNQKRGPQVRRLFVPSHPDHVFVKADFAQGEWRVVTILADEPYFAERFAARRDVVADLQEELFGSRTDKEFRTLTKNVAYGSWYGMILGRGKQGLRYAKHILHMDPDEAFAYQSKLFELASKIPQWQEQTRARVMAGETLETYKKRRRHFLFIGNTNKHEVLNECLAFVPQSTLSDICLTGLCELRERGHKVRLSTHDELVVECHWREAERVRKAMSDIMSEAATEFSTVLPFPVETSVGKSWGDC